MFAGNRAVIDIAMERSNARKTPKIKINKNDQELDVFENTSVSPEDTIRNTPAPEKEPNIKEELSFDPSEEKPTIKSDGAPDFICEAEKKAPAPVEKIVEIMEREAYEESTGLQLTKFITLPNGSALKVLVPKEMKYVKIERSPGQPDKITPMASLPVISTLDTLEQISEIRKQVKEREKQEKAQVKERKEHKKAEEMKSVAEELNINAFLLRVIPHSASRCKSAEAQNLVEIFKKHKKSSLFAGIQLLDTSTQKELLQEIVFEKDSDLYKLFHTPNTLRGKDTKDTAKAMEKYAIEKLGLDAKVEVEEKKNPQPEAKKPELKVEHKVGNNDKKPVPKVGDNESSFFKGLRRTNTAPKKGNQTTQNALVLHNKL